jgi:gluconate 2-dehydrogenase gamma chain
MADDSDNKKINGDWAPEGMGSISRRKVLGSAVSASTVVLIPLANTSCTTPVSAPQRILSREAWLILEAFTDRIIPADDNGPGAIAAGVPYYIDNSLADWNNNELDLLSEGLFALTGAARSRYDLEFQLLSDNNKDALLRDMEDGKIAGFDNSAQIFSRLHRLTLEGMFSDPYYGGNQNYAGWDLIGYPGAVMSSSAEMQKMGGRLPPLHTSAYGSDYDGE